MSTETPEVALWSAVLLRAMRDASPKPGADLLVQESARRWLVQGGRDFNTVCSFASFDPDWVRHRARSVQARGWGLEGWSGAAAISQKPTGLRRS